MDRKFKTVTLIIILIFLILVGIRIILSGQTESNSNDYFNPNWILTNEEISQITPEVEKKYLSKNSNIEFHYSSNFEDISEQKNNIISCDTSHFLCKMISISVQHKNGSRIYISVIGNDDSSGRLLSDGFKRELESVTIDSKDVLIPNYPGIKTSDYGNRNSVYLIFPDNPSSNFLLKTSDRKNNLLQTLVNLDFSNYNYNPNLDYTPTKEELIDFYSLIKSIKWPTEIYE